MIGKVFVAAAALMLFSPAFAEPLFQTYSMGASESEVLPNFPTAKFEQANSKDGVRAYRAEDFPSHDMWTYFNFYDGGLFNVTMRGNGAARYLEIVESLKAKYGKPTSETLAANSGLVVWNRGENKITARLRETYSTIVGPVVEPFSISYEPQSKALTDAL